MTGFEIQGLIGRVAGMPVMEPGTKEEVICEDKGARDLDSSINNTLALPISTTFTCWFN